MYASADSTIINPCQSCFIYIAFPLNPLPHFSEANPRYHKHFFHKYFSLNLKDWKQFIFFFPLYTKISKMNAFHCVSKVALFSPRLSQIILLKGVLLEILILLQSFGYPKILLWILMFIFISFCAFWKRW